MADWNNILIGPVEIIKGKVSTLSRLFSIDNNLVGVKVFFLTYNILKSKTKQSLTFDNKMFMSLEICQCVHMFISY
jgi:hypothetical protein